MNTLFHFVIFAVSVNFIVCNKTYFNNVVQSFKVYRLLPHTDEELEFVKNIRKSALNLKFNFWKDPYKVDKPCDVMVPPETQEPCPEVRDCCAHEFFDAKLSVDRLILDQEKDALWSEQIMHDWRGKKQKNKGPKFNFRKYQSYDTMTDFMDALENNYPNIVKVLTIGKSYENRPIKMIKIGTPVSSNSKKAIWIDAGIHAREWISHSTAMYFINELVTNYDNDPQIEQYLRNLTWYITPVVNPDGYEYTRIGKSPNYRLWRKNRAVNNGDSCIGVDLNRNFDFRWGDVGASEHPCDEDYKGSSAFSEPESRAVRDAVISRLGEIDAFVTLHSYSQIWMHPWGYQKNAYPPDVADLRSVANQATRRLKSMYGTEYVVGSGADTMYSASGASDDWAKSKGIKYVYLIELRPNDDNWDGFILSPKQIIPTGRETFEGMKVIADAVLIKNGFKLVKIT